jgi:hypothetical protein
MQLASCGFGRYRNSVKRWLAWMNQDPPLPDDLPLYTLLRLYDEAVAHLDAGRAEIVHV